MGKLAVGAEQGLNRAYLQKQLDG
ncbi:hypothetical protein CCACVL1_05787 [Corchorus capsularis]|uniref:Uncharacterized protein n=1 Tax=Corchorus capsularis TaxID=210143 RepID=A0A1R3JIZ5_COCAP|nr:hypothetical protein CCACVL1_05787 [Corchorus capsularis]